MSYTLSIGENGKNITNFYTSSESKIVGIASKERGSITFKAGSFTLNGKQIRIEVKDTLQTIVKKINKVSVPTGVTAKVEKNSRGHKLHLFSKKSTVEIQDQSGVLSKLYNNGRIGTSAKHLIQFTSKGGSGAVTISYNKSTEVNYSGLLLLAQLASIKIPSPIGNSLIVLNEVPDNIEDINNIPDPEILEGNLPQMVEGILDENDLDDALPNAVANQLDELGLEEIAPDIQPANEEEEDVIIDENNHYNNAQVFYNGFLNLYNQTSNFINRTGNFVSNKIFNIDEIDFSKIDF